MDRRRFLQSVPALAMTARAQTPVKPDVREKARMRTAICAYSFRKALESREMSYLDLVRLAVDTDTDGLDLTVYWFPSQVDELLAPLRGLAYRMGVHIYSLSIRTEMTRLTADQQNAEVAHISKWTDVAERLGAGHIRVFGGNVPNGATHEQAVAAATEVLKRAADYSGKKGIILGLENHGGITEKAETIISIVKEVNSPWIGINLDTGNFRIDPYTQIEMCAPYAVNVQFKSEIRTPEGKKSTSDWDRIGRILARAAYKGYLALEYEAEEDPARAVPRLMRQLRQVAHRHSSRAAS